MTITENPHIRRNHERRTQDTESLIRDAHLFMAACGISRGNSWVTRVVRDYLQASLAAMPFGIYLAARLDLNARQRRSLAERADMRYLLSYADPTGETAVRNVMRERAS